ncbi:MAG: SDR family oxidoreductase [Aquificota bacterium]|nr:MAG: SDR family oxidoreductase [Aquificota bacterium]
MKRVIIAGVRRIGYYIAKRLVSEGWSLGLIYRSPSKEVEELAQNYPERVCLARADLFYSQEGIRAVRELVVHLGGVDAFVHLASPYEPTPIEELTEEAIQYHFKPIAQSFLLMSKELYPFMLKNSGQTKGRIVAFGDWATNTTPYRNYSAYFVAKGALHTAVKVLAREFAPHVPVNAIALGPTLKPADFSEERWQDYINRTPLKRQVSLEDVVELTLFLLKVESMTGELINLDSGRHIAGECL